MFRYWLKHRAPISALLSVVMMAILIFGFVSPYINTIAENRNRLGVYENTEIDYDIPQPTKEQLREISELPFVTATFGYYYTESSVEVNGKSVMTKILFSEDLDNLDYTMYSDERLIAYTEKPYENPVYIDYAFAQENEVTLGDTLKLSNIVFQVTRIYETNAYYTSAIFMPLVGEQKTLIESKSASYSGAFLTVSNNAEAESYLNTYKPIGRLKDRSVFNSDAEYQLHYEQWENTSYANEITSFATKQSDVSVKDVLPVWVGAAIVVVVMLVFNVLAFNSKMEKGYFIAKRSKSNNGTFFAWTAIIEFIVMVVSALGLGYVTTKAMPYFCPISIYVETGVFVIAAVLGSVILGYIVNRIMLSGLKDSKAIGSMVTFKATIEGITPPNSIIAVCNDGVQFKIYVAKDTELCDASGQQIDIGELADGDEIKVTASMQESGKRISHCYQVRVLR